MKYREVLELYKQGKLEEERLVQVEADIERHEAISEYLFEEEVPGLEGLIHPETEQENQESAAEVQQGLSNHMAQKQKLRRVRDGASVDAVDLKFARMIHRSIRRAFVKLGITVVAVVVAVLLFVQFALPHIVDRMYYDADRVIAEEAGMKTTQLELDMAVYTELAVPNQYRASSWVEGNGFGEYDFIVYQNYSNNGPMVDVAGKIDKNHIVFYTRNVIEPLAGNVFTWDAEGELDYTVALHAQVDDSDGFGSASGPPEQAREWLEGLDEDTLYNGFVTLNQTMSYEEFTAFAQEYLDEHWIWCVPITGEQPYYHHHALGFFYTQNYFSHISWDKERYPLLSLYDVLTAALPEDAVLSEEDAIRHFTDMLYYMEEQKEFSQMLGLDSDGLAERADYVKEHGLRIYGFMVDGRKEDLLELMDREEVYTIYTKEAR